MTLRRTLISKLSGLFKLTKGRAKATGTVEAPQLYLNLTIKCVEQVDRMILLRAPTSPKFHREQCQYLLEKLKMAVQNAQSFLEQNNGLFSTFALDQDRARSLEIFKLLFVLAKGVESFIQGCCKDTWIRSAIQLSNVSEYISSLGFNLELCTIFFPSREKNTAVPRFTVEQVATISHAEATVVKEKANADEMRLITDANAPIHSSRSGSAESQLAAFLLKRMESPGQHPRPPGPVPNQSYHSITLFMNLEQLMVLGEGAFATVYKARWFGAEVAKNVFHGQGLAEFLREVSVLDGLRHPNIVSLLGYMRTDVHKCCVIMELMHGDLYSLMENRMKRGGISGSPFTSSEALDIMLQVAAGMLFPYEKNIVHRDLKSHDILVKWVKSKDSVNVMYLHAKVADFGLSKTKENSVTYSDQTKNQGTSRWMAPEMIKTTNNGESFQCQRKLKYPFKCDIYSFAMVCCEILTGHVPFPNLSPTEVKKKVLAGDRPQLPSECPAGLRTLIEACWSPDPSERPYFGEICAKIRLLKCEHLMECTEL